MCGPLLESDCSSFLFVFSPCVISGEKTKSETKNPG